MLPRDGGPIAAILEVASKVDKEVFRRLEEGELARRLPFLSTREFRREMSEISLMDNSREGVKAGEGLAQSLGTECIV